MNTKSWSLVIGSLEAAHIDAMSRGDWAEHGRLTEVLRGLDASRKARKA